MDTDELHGLVLRDGSEVVFSSRARPRWKGDDLIVERHDRAEVLQIGPDGQPEPLVERYGLSDIDRLLVREPELIPTLLISAATLGALTYMWLTREFTMEWSYQ